MGKSLKSCLIVLAALFSLQLNAADNSQQERQEESAEITNISPTRPTLSELLLSMGAALNNGNYQLSLVYLHDGQVDSLRLSHLSTENHEYDMLEHLQGPRRMVLSHNNDTWLYTGKQKLHISNDEETPVIRWRRQLERLARNIANYKVVISGVDRIAGRIAYRLNFISKDKNRYSTRLWIDAQYRLPLRLDSINSENKIIEQMLTVNLNYPAKLTTKDFEVNEGFNETIDLKMEFSKQQELNDYNGKWQVNWLPAGYELSLRKFRKSESERFEQWMFSDGLSTLSVFLEPGVVTGRNKKSTFVMGDEVIFDLIIDNRRITVVGNVPLKTAEKIAQSVSYNNPLQVPQPAIEQTH